jgi:uncharacterized protein YwqG
MPGIGKNAEARRVFSVGASMSFLNRIFGKKKDDSAEGKGIDEHLEYLNSLRQPAIGLQKSEERRLSKIGGLPNLPGVVPWPQWKGKPLAFLCQVDLADLPLEYSFLEFPRTGYLFFFYDQEQSTWGFDAKDKDSWRVLYVPDEVRDCPPKEAPERLKKSGIYSEKPVTFSLLQIYPDWQDSRVNSLGLTRRQSDEYITLCSSVFEDGPQHHLFGYPSPVQDNDMDLECQLASHGLYCGDRSGYEDPRARELEPGRSDWTLLLQLDTDDETRMMWGDGGMLYFWIRKDDLKAGRFEDCWMILQCY